MPDTETPTQPQYRQAIIVIVVLVTLLVGFVGGIAFDRAFAPQSSQQHCSTLWGC